MTFRILGAPQRYVQGAGAFHRLAEEVRRLDADSVSIVIDPVARKLLSVDLEAQLPGARLLSFGGECTAVEIATRAAEAYGSSLVLGIGGGKAIDTAKGVAIERNIPVGIVPTIASNDSPTSHIAVIYTSDHAVESVRHMRSNPAFVLVDTRIIAAAPRQFLAAGIGDAMSKPYELAGALSGGGLNFFGGTPPELAKAIVSHAQKILLTDGVKAIRSATPDAGFERVVEATILLSGLAFESGGLSIAHSMVRGFSKLPQLAQLLHGEMVALGTLVQLALGQGSKKELVELAEFFRTVGLPTSLSALGVSESGDLELVAEATLTAPYAANYARTLMPDDIVTAIKVVEELARP